MARLMKMSLGITFIALIVGYVAALDEGLLTVSRCKDKGFAPGATACSVCSKLEDVLTASGSSDAGSIVSDCLSCCSPAIDAVSPTKFQAAHLTVCRYSLQNHGGVNEFLEKSSFKDVITVNDVMGASPSLTLQGAIDSDGPALNIGIAGWKIEQIEAFLRLKTAVIPRTEGQS